MRRWLISLGAIGMLVGASLLLYRNWRPNVPALPSQIEIPSVSRVEPITSPERPSALAGLDLAHVSYDDSGATTSTSDGRLMHLTLDPDLQGTAERLMAHYRVAEASVVMMEAATGKVLAYASHLSKGQKRDLNAEATAPAASLFKIVTGAALIEHAALTPDTKQCYFGGQQRVDALHLVDDPKRDRWCSTLAGAMGRSLNTVFARLAKKHLPPSTLQTYGKKFGFGESVPFDLPTQPSTLSVPSDELEYARTAAGFWNTTLSPLHATWLSAAIAHGGEAVRPYIVRDVVDREGHPLYEAQPSLVVRRFISLDTAKALTVMMEATVSDGTSYRAFRDARKRPFLSNLSVAGKTGTLSDAQANRHYSWFSGFAPSRSSKLQIPQVAIAVLVVNDPTWEIKANVLARDMLRAYFASRGVAKVTKPGIPERRKRRAHRHRRK